MRPISVTVRSTTTTDAGYGDTTSTDVDTTIDGVLFAPRGSQERVNSQSPAVYVAASLYLTAGLPDGVTLDSDDSVIVAGVSPLADGTYQVEGIPGYWDGQVEVAVTRTSGV